VRGAPTLQMRAGTSDNRCSGARTAIAMCIDGTLIVGPIPHGIDGAVLGTLQMKNHTLRSIVFCKLMILLSTGQENCAWHYPLHHPAAWRATVG